MPHPPSGEHPEQLASLTSKAGKRQGVAGNTNGRRRRKHGGGRNGRALVGAHAKAAADERAAVDDSVRKRAADGGGEHAAARGASADGGDVWRWRRRAGGGKRRAGGGQHQRASRNGSDGRRRRGTRERAAAGGWPAQPVWAAMVGGGEGAEAYGPRRPGGRLASGDDISMPIVSASTCLSGDIWSGACEALTAAPNILAMVHSRAICTTGARSHQGPNNASKRWKDFP